MQLFTPIFHCRTLLASLGFALTAAAAQAQVPAVAPSPMKMASTSRYPGSSIGLTLGYGAPYGWGIDFSFMAQPNLDVNVGLGFSLTGGKLGVGTRYYFTPERKVSPFVSGNLVYSTGLNHITLTTNSTNAYGGYYSNSKDDVVVNFKSTGLLHVRGGVRWQPVRRFGLIGAVGYGIVLGGDPVEYVGGARDRQMLVDFFSPGGVELSVGVTFPLGRGD